MSKPTPVPTAHDVAQLAGVSQATVSYVLSGRSSGSDRISEATRQRILDAVAELNYVPNSVARSLRRNRTERICLILPGIGAPFYDQFVRAMNQAADAHNYSAIISIAGSADRELHILDQLQRRLADGAVFITPSHISADDLVPLVRANVALVVVSNYISGAGFDAVRTNEHAACAQAIQYLLQRGHRRIAFLGQCSSESIRLERLESYQNTLHAHGIALDPALVRGSDNAREHAYRDTQAWLQSHEHPTAIFAASDIAAISALWAVRDAGLRVPDDVAIIGVGNIPEGDITKPPLTTVGSIEPEADDILDLLFSRLRGEAPVAGRVVEHRWELIIRASA